MRQFKTVMLLIAISMLLCACPDKEEGHRYITIVNQSGKTIVWQPRRIRIGETDEHYNCQYIPGESIHDNSSCKFDYDDRGNNWEVGLNTPYLQVMLMDAETYDKYIREPCDTIRKYVPILHIYRLTLIDLQRMNWIAVYPPEE
jgi:hypothetical protein